MTRFNAAVLSSEEIARLLLWTHENSRSPLRDRLVLLLSFTCGMRITEIARVKVRDVLTSTGLPLKEVSLRAAITKGSKARCAYLSHSSAIATLNEYIAWRVAEGHGVDLRSNRFCGLMPDSELIVTRRGRRFELTTKHRVSTTGDTVDYLAADGLQKLVTKIYREAGFGARFTSHSGRRTFASRLLAQGRDVTAIQALLGHASLDHLLPYLEVPESAYRDAFREIF